VRPNVPTVIDLLADGLNHHHAGRLEEAERRYLQILSVDGRHADSFHLLGLIAYRRKRLESAVELINKAIFLNGNIAAFHCNIGVILKDQGRLTEAVASYERAIALQPDYAEAHNNLGNAFNDQGKLNAAVASYERALALKPDYAEAHNNLGTALNDQGKLNAAVASYERAIALQPDYAEAHNNLGNAFKDQGKLNAAVASYERALALKPDYVEAHNNLGNAFKDQGKLTAAVASYERALALQPDYAEAHNNLGTAFNDQGKLTAAVASYERALALKPNYAEPHNNLGNALRDEDKLTAAVASYERALALKPNFAEAHNNLGTAFKDQGKLTAAAARYEQALALKPDYAAVYLNLADMKKFALGDPHLAAMEALAANTEGLSKTDRMQLDFGLAKAYADLKDYPRSFKRLIAGNAAKRATVEYDEISAFARFERIEAVFTRELIVGKSGGGDPSHSPIFVIGMPRSGTTLVEQIIASHRLVHGGGELKTLHNVVLEVCGPDGSTTLSPESAPALDAAALCEIGTRYVALVRELAARDGGAKTAHVTDKMPSNYYFAGLIHLALPNAKIIHTIRDPVDTCVSCFSTLFSHGQNHTYDLIELGRYYKRYERLMTHWRHVLPQGSLLDVRYEDVVADLEAQARRIIAYCGLPWDDSCLSFHEAERPVRTASATQVRQPIYTSSVGRWRVHKEHLGPLLTALGIESAYA